MWDVTDLKPDKNLMDPTLIYKFRTKFVLTLYKRTGITTDSSEYFCNEPVYASKDMIYIAETYHKINICEKLVNYLDKYE